MKEVRFAPRCRVRPSLSRWDYSPSEVTASWLTASDIQAIHSDARRTLVRLDQLLLRQRNERNSFLSGSGSGEDEGEDKDGEDNGDRTVASAMATTMTSSEVERTLAEAKLMREGMSCRGLERLTSIRATRRTVITAVLDKQEAQRYDEARRYGDVEFRPMVVSNKRHGDAPKAEVSNVREEAIARASEEVSRKSREKALKRGKMDAESIATRKKGCDSEAAEQRCIFASNALMAFADLASAVASKLPRQHLNPQSRDDCQRQMAISSSSVCQL